MDLDRGRFEALQHGNQAASEDVIADHPGRAQNESSPAQRRRYRRIMVVRPQPAADGNIDIAGLGSKSPFLGALEEGEDDAVVVLEVLRLRWFAAALEVRGGGANNAAEGPELAGDEGGVFESSGSDGNVDAFLDQVGDAVEEQEFDAELGITLQELGQKGGEVEAAKQPGRGR